MQLVTEVRRRDFMATNRGGGLYSEAVSQPIGSAIAFAAARLGLRPTTLTLTNLVLCLAASVTVVLLPTGGWPVGVLALVAWQLAYAFDCADGQLARVTGRTSAAGARLDVLCDVAAQIGLVSALSAMTAAYRPATPTWVFAAFAGTWMVNLVTSVMQSGPHAASMVASRSLPVRVVKLVRDYGAVVLVCGLVLTFAPQWTIVAIGLFGAVNALFLLASIAFAARRSLAG
ncbi:MAG: CDP-alcohol phosphatidyltransferase family protein [Micromonosporaceae bacterium]